MKTLQNLKTKSSRKDKQNLMQAGNTNYLCHFHPTAQTYDEEPYGEKNLKFQLSLLFH